MGTFFAAGGMGMYPTLAFGLLFVGAAVAWLVDPRPRGTTLCAILGGVTFLSGALSLTLSAVTTLVAVRRFPPPRQYAVMLSGLGEALNNLSLALVLIIVGSLIVAGGALRSALRERGVGAGP